MSTRWYPIYQKGGPQLRVFLPNFWMKLVRPETSQPLNVAQFACSMEMTKFDIKNYLEKIYNIKVVDVRTRIAMGRTKKAQHGGYIIKEDDVKYAYVTMPKDAKFEFPDIFPPKTEEIEEHEKSLEEAKQGFNNYLEKNKERPNLPSWFTI